MNTIVFMDLDDSIFQTRRKCGEPGPLRVGALGGDGAPLSFLRPGQAHLFEHVFQGAAVVPVTARNLDSFGRVVLNFEHGAIVDFGGLILTPAGEVDQQWLAETRPLCLTSRGRLLEALAGAEELVEKARLGCRVRLIGDQGLDFYVQAKNHNGRLEELDEIMALFSERFPDLAIHRNGNNLAALPPFLNKARALPYHLEKHLGHLGPERLVLALGDSLTDVDFMRLCDYLIIPAGSQLERRL